MTFQDVYRFAENSLIENHWRLIPKDIDEDDEDEFSTLKSIFKMLGFVNKKKYQIPSWDYCEILIRTVVNCTFKLSLFPTWCKSCRDVFSGDA